MGRRYRGSVYKVKDSANWILSWRTPDGARHTKSSGTHLKGKAEDMLDDIVDDVKDGKQVTAAKLTVTFGDAADTLERQLGKIKQIKSWPMMARRIRLHLEPFFGRKRL